MAGELLSPDVLKLAFVALLGAGYAAYKGGLLERLRIQSKEREAQFTPRPLFPPGRIRFEKAVLDVCGVDHLQLIRTTARLRKMGFWIVGDFTLPAVGSPLGASQKTYARAFVHGEEPMYAIAVERKGPKSPPQYVDFLTLFSDQTFLMASTSEEMDDPRRPGALRFHRLGGLLPEEVFQHHKANLEALKNNWLKPVPASRDSFFAHYRQALAVDFALRKAKDEEVRKDQIVRTLESLPALDIGPILKRYDGQRTPFEFGSKSETIAPVFQTASPTVIRDPERAPIRRRIPGTGAPIAPQPAAGAVPVDPTYGDALSRTENAFESAFTAIPPAPPLEIAQAHPLDLLDRLDTGTPLPGETFSPEPESGLYRPWDQGDAPAAEAGYDLDQGFALTPGPDYGQAMDYAYQQAPEPAFGQAGDVPSSVEPPAPDFSNYEAPAFLTEDAPQESVDALPFELGESAPPEPVPFDAPARCPHCNARTLSRYSSRCARCRQPLLEASGS